MQEICETEAGATTTAVSHYMRSALYKPWHTMATASPRHSLLLTNNIKLLITDDIVPEKIMLPFQCHRFWFIFTTKLPCVLSKKNKRKKIKIIPPIPLTLQT
jgi:hypothetical protein